LDFGQIIVQHIAYKPVYIFSCSCLPSGSITYLLQAFHHKLTCPSNLTQLLSAAMTTIALARPIPPHRPSSTITPPLSLENSSASSSSQCSGPIPNKHLPICPTGPACPDELDTPPPSPPAQDQLQQTSALYPLDGFKRIDSGELSIYELDATRVAEAVDVASRQPLPDPALVFPWFHGLHPQNHVQQSFFAARRRASRPTPSCIRALTIVKADGDLNCARLKGAIAPNEIIQANNPARFIEADPREGFSVRNFQIQTVKTAVLSDIIVYGRDLTKTRKVAWDIASAQKLWREKHQDQGEWMPEYHTFITFSKFFFINNLQNVSLLLLQPRQLCLLYLLLLQALNSFTSIQPDNTRLNNHKLVALDDNVASGYGMRNMF
jgi:5'(3')-deoxyribonucleotidase